MIETAAVVGHVPGGLAGAGHHAEQIDPHDTVELLEVLGEQPFSQRAGDAGVVDHHMQPAECGHRRRHQLADLRLITDIGVAVGRPMPG